MNEAPRPTPREPEIELLGRAARTALLVLRGAGVVVGTAAIGIAVYVVFRPEAVYAVGEQGAVPPRSAVIADMIAPVCFGLPLALPVAFTLGRGRWPALLIGLGLWFLPMLLDGDRWYGFLLRMFASLVGVAILAVWKTLFGLTRPRLSD